MNRSTPRGERRRSAAGRSGLLLLAGFSLGLSSAAFAAAETSHATNPRSLERQDRAKVRAVIAQLRAVPDHLVGFDEINSPKNGRIPLGNGADALTSETRTTVRGETPFGRLTVHGRITTSGDDALVLLNAKERQAALRAIQGEGFRGVRWMDTGIRRVDPTVSKEVFARAFASTSPDARNYLVLQKMRVKGL